MGLEWETMFYWHRRAQEIFFTANPRKMFLVEESVEIEIDEDAFKKSEAYLNKRLAEIEKAKEGTING